MEPEEEVELEVEAEPVAEVEPEEEVELEVEAEPVAEVEPEEEVELENEDSEVNLHLHMDVTPIAFAMLYTLFAEKKLSNKDFEAALRKLDEFKPHYEG